MTETTDHAGMRVHPPSVMLFYLVAALILNRFFPFPKMMPSILAGIGVALVFAGLGLAFLAVGEFRRAGTTLDPHGSVKTVVTSGPYQFSRNPIYLGFVCTVIGLPMALGTYWGVALSPLLMLSLYLLVIRYEETYLEGKFGEAYASYRSRVRRWL